MNTTTSAKIDKPLPLTIKARDYAEAAADKIYLQAWPIATRALERALAAAFEAGWRARHE